ncbi:MAG: hypothetical protein HQL75_01075 [Magnetococcales bacterium]|nr:hypothetical protein [Magnetococcales bacterium]
MGVQHVFESLKKSGLKVSILDGDQLLVTPREKITAESRAMIREHKAGLVRLLQGVATGTPNPPPGRPTTFLQEPGTPTPDSHNQAEESLIMTGEDAFQERSSIIESEGRIPRDWAEGLARIATMDRPNDIPPRRWEMIVKTAAIFAERWAAEASRLGWTTEEVFGIHQHGPNVRFDSMGLVYSLADDRVSLESIDHEKAVIRVNNGAVQTFRREPSGRSAVRLLWDQGRQQ